MKILKLVAALALSLSLASAAQAARIALVDASGAAYSNTVAAANAVSSGSTVTNVTGGFMNSQSAAFLSANYDAVIFSWAGSSYATGYWNTLQTYLNAGGGVIFDGAEGATGAFSGSGVSFFGSSSYSFGNQTVTDNTFISSATVHGANHHLGGLSGTSDWTTFLQFGSTKLGLYNNIGAGKVIVTSTDFFYHGSSADDRKFMTEELAYVLSDAEVPEPSSVALLGLGLMGVVVASRRAKRKSA